MLGKPEFWSNRELRTFQCFENSSFEWKLKFWCFGLKHIILIKKSKTQVWYWELEFWVYFKMCSKTSNHDFPLWKGETWVCVWKLEFCLSAQLKTRVYIFKTRVCVADFEIQIWRILKTFLIDLNTFHYHSSMFLEMFNHFVSEFQMN